MGESDPIVRQDSGACTKCISALTDNALRMNHSSLRQAGRTVIYVYPIGQTEYRYLQCESCGELWEEVYDNDPGDHGRHRRPLTPDLQSQAK